MKRREFLKYTGVLGLGSMLPALPSRSSYAAYDSYTGPLWLNINAAGGWDPTLFCDPKGYRSATDPDRLNNYPGTAIQTVNGGPIRIAPAHDGYDTSVQSFRAMDFFQKYRDRLLVINGIDYQTNAHSDGQQYCWSGKLANQGYPNTAALIAAELAGNRTMPFITSGGYSFGAELVTPVQITNRVLSAILEIAYPNRSHIRQISGSSQYYPDDVLALIKSTRDARLTALQSGQRLIRARDAIDRLVSVRQSGVTLSDFADFLESNPPSRTSADFNNRSAAYDAYVQGHFALAARKVGVSASAQISISGFDTHDNHDDRHYPRLLDYLQAVDAILEEASLPAFELNDNLVISMGSDFGRTNRYNEQQGKDHWPVSSMMFIGNSQQTIRGNRVIGQTTDDYHAIKIDPVTLEADINNSNPSAISITPAHIQYALRRLAGIEYTENSNTYDLNCEAVDFFS